MHFLEIIGTLFLRVKFLIDSLPVFLDLNLEEVHDLRLSVLELGEKIFQEVVMPPLNQVLFLL
jgi:hypothetical protein